MKKKQVGMNKMFIKFLMKRLHSLHSRLPAKSRETKFILFSISSLLLIIISTLLISVTDHEVFQSYSVGDMAREDIRSPKDIEYLKDAETLARKKRIMENIPLVFDKNLDALDEDVKQINLFFQNIDSFRTSVTNNGENSEQAKDQVIKQLKLKFPKIFEYNDSLLVRLINRKDLRHIQSGIIKLLDYVHNHPELHIIPSVYSNPLQIESSKIVIRLTSPDSETIELPGLLQNVIAIDEFKSDIHFFMEKEFPDFDHDEKDILMEIICMEMTANTVFNYEETQNRISKALENIQPVKGYIKKGQLIVKEGEHLSFDQVDKISIINKHSQISNMNHSVGIFLVQLIFVSILGFLFKNAYNKIIPDLKSVIINFSLIIMFFIFAVFIYDTTWFKNSNFCYALLLPLPFLAMMISILYNTHLSIYMCFYAIFFTMIISGGDWANVIIAFSSCILGVSMNKDVYKRTDFLKNGLLIGITNAIIIFSIMLFQDASSKIISQNIQLALCVGVLNSILALGIVPVYENVFGLTTKFKLLELADLNSDIFKRMLLEAPGTYNHSLVVSSLAESACKSIGADHLMARVGAYYHDIGKIMDPNMFIENGVTDARAKTLSPNDYSQLIISHVAKGVQLAQHYKLPPAIIEFIQQHHGKTIMSFFYYKALEQKNKSNSDEEIIKANFQYLGPKPHSKEIAVVMLADVIEAASRSIENPNHQKLEGLVNKIIYNKLNDGELEETNLSMMDLSIIKNSFLTMLNGIFHTRIEYPEMNDLKNLESKLNKKT